MKLLEKFLTLFRAFMSKKNFNNYFPKLFRHKGSKKTVTYGKHFDFFFTSFPD